MSLGKAGRGIRVPEDNGGNRYFLYRYSGTERTVSSAWVSFCVFLTNLSTNHRLYGELEVLFLADYYYSTTSTVNGNCRLYTLDFW